MAAFPTRWLAARARAVSGPCAVTLVLLASPAGAVYVPHSELPEAAARSVDYRLDVQLDPATKQLTGSAEIRWTNRTPVPAREIFLHLYLNAFRNNRSTFMQESRGRHRRWTLEEGEWGWIELTSVKIGNGPDISGAVRYVQPDDENIHDRTVVAVPLDTEIPGGESVQLHLDYKARLPRVFARTGHKGNFYMVAQWYPKPGVFQREAGWNVHQFHANSEFFADFASFDVRITVPQGYVVGATGRQVATPVENLDGTTTYRFAQTDVHDFAWTADPDFLTRVRRFSYADERDESQERELAAILGYGLEDLALDDVRVTVLLQPEHEHQADRIFRAAFAAIRQYGYWYGRYPYETLTIVDPQHGARGAGGMEYPTLITIGSDWLAPAASLSPEGVTIHEFGHQYWYGLVASNEFEEAWLDEGFTTYSTGKVLEAVYGPRRGVMTLGGLPLVMHPLARLPERPAQEEDGARPRPAQLHFPPSPWPGAAAAGNSLEQWLFLQRLGLPDFSLLRGFRDLPPLNALRHVPVSAVAGYRPEYLAGATKDILVRRAWEYMDRSSYHLNAYSRSALVLHTLERFLGEATMLRVLRKYHEYYRFRHPTSADFIRVAREISGRNLDPLTDLLIQGSGVLDYAVTEVTSESIPPDRGIFASREGLVLRDGMVGRPGPLPQAGGAPAEGDEASRPHEYRNEVLVRRLGSVTVPVVVELEYDDGSTERRLWDGDYRWERIVVTGPRRVRRATVDPDGVYVIDIRWSNNPCLVEPDRRPATRWSLRLLLWMQSVLAFYGGLT
jgi:hypothetical protein